MKIMAIKNHRLGLLAPDGSVKMSGYWCLKVFGLCGRLTALVFKKLHLLWQQYCVEGSVLSEGFPYIMCGPISQHGTFFQGVALTPAAVPHSSSCGIPTDSTPKWVSAFTLHFSNSLWFIFKKSDYVLKQIAHDVTILFLAVILGKKNTSLCLVIINQSGTCAHTGLPQQELCVLPLQFCSGP